MSGRSAWKLLAFGLATALPAQARLADLNRRPRVPSSNPAAFVRLGNAVYFAATTSGSGRELWVTDASGVRMVRDIRPGPNGSSPVNLVAAGSLLYFTADDGDHGDELWRTDGTAAGTVMVRDVHPGSAGALRRFGYHPYGVSRGRVFFAADDGVHGEEVWITDGANTSLLVDANPGPSGSRPEEFCRLGLDMLIAYGGGLWRSDGTPAGTVQLGSVTSPTELTRLGAHVYFSGNSTATGFELFRTDGTTAGTTLVFDANPGSGHGFPSGMASDGSKLFFAANVSFATTVLFCTDGVQGVSSLHTFTGFVRTAFERAFCTAGSRLFFLDADAQHGAEPWVSDGTAAGTTLLKDLVAGAAGSAPSHFQAVGTDLYFYADVGGGVFVPWRSDGTPAGTLPLSAARRPAIDRYVPSWFVADAAGHAHFTAIDSATGAELWGSDGTAAGTALIADLDPAPPGATEGSDPGPAIDFAGRTVFAADDGVHGAEPWIRDGAGTRLLLDVEPGAAGSDPRELTLVGGLLFFTATTSAAGAELWVTDGTAPGTRIVHDIRPGSASARPRSLVEHRGTLFFAARDATAGVELWRSDGTRPGTSRVADVLPGAGSSNPDHLTSVGSWLLFQAEGSAFDEELWRSDGTAAGTRLVLDVRPGSAGSNPEDFVRLGERLVFTADTTGGTFTNPAGQELWVTDGTTPGTSRVRDLLPGGDAELAELTSVGAKVFFTADLPASGRELWVTDGTTAGTVLVADIRAGVLGADPRGLTAFGDSVLFSADDGTHGHEPWISDGTPGGTRPLIDLWPGPGSSSPHAFLAPGQRFAWFAAHDGTTGVELWRTDGNTTTLVGDARSGSLGIDPLTLAVSGHELLLAGDDGVHGREPWLADPGAFVVPLGSGCTGAAFPPTLRSDDPALGTLMTIEGSDAGQARAALLVIGRPASAPTAIGGTCYRVFDPAGAVVIGPVAVAGGTWRLVVPIPSATALIGVELAAQAVTAPGTGAFGLDWTRGLRWVVGI